MEPQMNADERRLHELTERVPRVEIKRIVNNL
jgi:hypothetical protein